MAYVLIKEESFEKARKEIKKNQGKVIFSSDNDETNRKVLEKEKIEIFLINQKNRKDFQKQRNSGFNQVLAKIAKKENVVIGVNLDEIIDSSQKAKAEVLARVRQNIKLCNKNKIKMKFISLKKENQRNTHDLKALGSILGMPSWMTSNFTRE